MRKDFNFFLSQTIDWLVCMLILSVQSTASFFTLMLGINYSVFMSIEMPIQLHNFVSMF